MNITCMQNGTYVMCPSQITGNIILIVFYGIILGVGAKLISGM